MPSIFGLNIRRRVYLVNMKKQPDGSRDLGVATRIVLPADIPADVSEEVRKKIPTPVFVPAHKRTVGDMYFDAKGTPRLKQRVESVPDSVSVADRSFYVFRGKIQERPEARAVVIDEEYVVRIAEAEAEVERARQRVRELELEAIRRARPLKVKDAARFQANNTEGTA